MSAFSLLIIRNLQWVNFFIMFYLSKYFKPPNNIFVQGPVWSIYLYYLQVYIINLNNNKDIIIKLLKYNIYFVWNGQSILCPSWQSLEVRLVNGTRCTRNFILKYRALYFFFGDFVATSSSMFYDVFTYFIQSKVNLLKMLL